MFLYQPHADLAGISWTPRELSSPPSAVCAAAEREGDNRRHDLDNVKLWSRSVHLLLHKSEKKCKNTGQVGRPAQTGLLDPPPAGPPAASRPGWSLFVSAGAAAQCFSPPSSSSWQFLMISHLADASGLWRPGSGPEGGEYWIPWIMHQPAD